MSQLKIAISVGMPAPAEKKQVEKKQEQKEPEESLEDKVREALDCIDSGHCSRVEWSMINSLYRDLKALKKPNDRAKNLIKMIDPVLSKYGYHEVPTNKKD